MGEKILIMGAAGRDFHVFNCCYRERSDTRVVAFTAAQIPHIDDRRYPPALAGARYPDGIPILPEQELERLIADERIDQVVFAYSDVSLAYVAERRRRVEALGAKFSTFDVDATMLTAGKPVVAVTAVRTGCGKSQTSRRVSEMLRKLGQRVVVIRHPMPYGDLTRQAVQRFAEVEDLDRHDCTIEEREDYEHHLRAGNVLYAGIDYAAILAEAEREADAIVWDGGNNDTPFLRPDLWIVVTDPHRAGHELSYFPGTENFARADLILINKVDSAKAADVETIERNAREVNPVATVVRASSPLSVPQPESIRGKRVLAIEDGPTLTHGDMKFGAGVLAARRHGAAELVDPRPWAVGEIAQTFEAYPATGALLPAMGYGRAQMRDLEQTVNAVDCDLVLVATPMDLSEVIKIKKPHLRVGYSLAEEGDALKQAVERALAVTSPDGSS